MAPLTASKHWGSLKIHCRLIESVPRATLQGNWIVGYICKQIKGRSVQLWHYTMHDKNTPLPDKPSILGKGWNNLIFILSLVELGSPNGGGRNWVQFYGDKWKNQYTAMNWAKKNPTCPIRSHIRSWKFEEREKFIWAGDDNGNTKGIF